MIQIYYSLVALITMAFIPIQTQTQITSDELNHIMETARKKYDIPAVAVVLMNSNELLLSEIQGVRVANSDNQASLNDYFHIGSTSKSVLAVLAGKQVEQGTISWDTKIFDVFPELKAESNPGYYNVTLEDLFLCKAGIKPFTSGDEVYPELEPETRMEFGKWLLKQNPASKPGKDGKFNYLYSNAGYTLISLMLEKVSGKTYEDLLHEMLNDELGLDPIFGWPNKHKPDQPWGHGNFSIQSDGSVQMSKSYTEPFSPEHPYKLNDLIRPAGDISMKPKDFARYTQLHLKGLRGTDNYLKAATYKNIDLAYRGFSYGVYNYKQANKQVVVFDGSAGTFYCRGLPVPDDDIGLVILINSGNQKAVDWLTAKIFKKHYNWWWKFWI